MENITKNKSFFKKNKIIIICIILIICASVSYFAVKYDRGFDIIQLTSTTESQMMGYVIKTDNNKLIVVDGGTSGDNKELVDIINENGGHVDTWIFTHSHKDHTGAFVDLITNNSNILIDNIYVSLNDIEWAKTYDSTRISDYEAFYEALKSKKDIVDEVTLNQEIKVDNVLIDILGIKNPEITINSGNNQSVVFKLYVNNTNMLFLGDTGIQSGSKLIERLGKSLKSDVVQMSHHGQNGVNEDFYKAVNPNICFWPTPDWLWDNDSGSGEDSGNYSTKETREWIRNIGVNKNYIAKDGIIKIRIW